jgi:thiamine biosynthesis lipoprotein
MRVLLLLAVLALGACEDRHGSIDLIGSTMGTRFTITLPNGLGEYVPVRLQKDIEAALEDDEAQMSTYQPDSLISYINRSDSTQWLQVLDSFCRKVERSQQISELTGGAFDITVGPLVNLWGFGPDDMISEPPDDDAIAALKAVTGYKQLQTDCSRPAIRKNIAGLMLDMSAIGKGFAADRVAELLEELGFEDYLVEIGGELRLRGHNAAGKPWAIGIEAPLEGVRKPHTIVHLTDTAMATSGDYRNYFEAGGQRYSHTIDTRTGRPVTHSVASVTVVDPSAWRADALATALLVMGPEEGMAFATRENLAVLMLLRTENGLEELQTAAFEQLRAG